MANFMITKNIAAPPSAVFALFADLERCPQHIKDITKLEIVTNGPVGVGTRFRETRKMYGREHTEEMQITAFDPPLSYEVTCLSCGAEIRCEFRFVPENGGTRLELSTHTRSITFFAKLFTPLSWLMMGSMKKCMEKDLDDLKKAAEGTLVA